MDSDFIELFSLTLKRRRWPQEELIQSWSTFPLSPHYSQDFLKRHTMSLRRTRLARRPTTTDAQMHVFVKRVRELIRDKGTRERIINFSEAN
jgi:hypothetical protein